MLEPAADLAVLCAAVSAAGARPDFVVFGEIGLAGEVSGGGRERIREAANLVSARRAARSQHAERAAGIGDCRKATGRGAGRNVVRLT